jgi:hypothetical protein
MQQQVLFFGQHLMETISFVKYGTSFHKRHGLVTISNYLVKIEYRGLEKEQVASLEWMNQ